MRREAPYLFVWKRQFRMLYVYFGVYSFRVGAVNRKPSVGFTRTWKWHLKKNRAA